VKATVLRFTFSERLQHIVLMVSLIVLVLTGLSLMFHQTVWGRFMIQLEGGLAGRGLIHRLAAVLLIAVTIYHYFYTLLSRRGHEILMEYLPHKGDWGKFFQTLRFNFGMDEKSPEWGQFTFFQKVQYLGVILGVLIMIVTGLVLWLGPQAIALMPKWLVDLTLIVHGSEGLLIFLIMLFWHLYNVHLAPGNFPMNMSWLTGRITVEELRNRYPAQYRKLKSEGVLDE
jgi:cytochrome b subunit of formate dehydrogenase